MRAKVQAVATAVVVIVVSSRGRILGEIDLACTDAMLKCIHV